jgi:hypothetical protein
MIKRAEDIFCELVRCTLEDTTRTSRIIIEKYQNIKANYLDNVITASSPLDSSTMGISSAKIEGTELLSVSLGTASTEDVTCGRCNAPPLVLVVQAKQEDGSLSPVSGTYDLDIVKLKDGGVNGQPTWNKRETPSSSTADGDDENDDVDDMAARYLLSKQAKSSLGLGSLVLGHKLKQDESKKYVLFSTKTFNWAISQKDIGVELFCTEPHNQIAYPHEHSFPHTMNWGWRVDGKWKQLDGVSVTVHCENSITVSNKNAFDDAMVDEFRVKFNELRLEIEMASCVATMDVEHLSLAKVCLTPLLELSLCAEMAVATNLKDVTRSMKHIEEVTRTLNLSLSPSVLRKLKVEEDRLRKSREMKDVSLGLVEFNSLILFAQRLNEEQGAASDLFGGKKSEGLLSVPPPEKIVDRKKASHLLTSINVMSGGMGVQGGGCYRCESNHGVAFRKFPHVDDRIDDIIRGPDHNDVVFGYVIKVKASAPEVSLSPFSMKKKSANTEMVEDWIVVEVKNFGTLFLPLRKGSITLFRRIFPIPSSGLNLASFHTFSSVSSSSIKASYTKNPSSLIFTGSNRRELCELMVGNEEKGKVFSVLVIKSNKDAPTNENLDDKQETMSLDTLRDELRAEMTRALGEVFQQWPRAGWNGGSVEFIAAFNSSFASKDQIFVSVVALVAVLTT